MEGTAGLAAHLGISRWTVSRVLNGHAGVREETRRRVLEAVEELGFEPNRLARGLRGLPSGLVGVSFPFLEAAILAEKSRVLQTELHEAGLRGIFEIPEGDPEVEAEVIRHFLSIQVEGMVLMAPTLQPDDPILTEVRSRGVGIVAVDPQHELPVSTVSLDRKGAMVMKLRHLHGLGHRRIAILGLGSDELYRDTRMEGLRKGCRELGLDPERDLVRVDEPGLSWRDYRCGAVLAEKALALPAPRPTAFFCLNDRLAIGALRVLLEAGHAVPGDCSVIGFDNVGESQWCFPSLSTVDQNIANLMRWVRAALLDSIGGGLPRKRQVRPRLVLRESTGPVRRRL